MLAAGCSSGRGSGNRAGEEAEVVATVYTPRHARGFRIDSLADGRKRIVTLRPWQGAEGVEKWLDVDGAPGRMAVMSATHIAMLRQLGETGRLACLSSLPYVYDPRIRAAFGPERDFGYEGNVDYEKLVASGADMVVIYSTGGESPMERKLSELGLRYLYFGDYAEQDPLGKAEWVVAMGELCSKRPEAEAAFRQTERAYLRLSGKSGSKAGGEGGCKSGSKAGGESGCKSGSQSAGGPKVMVNAPYGDSWFCPPADSYAVRLIEDGGGSYLLADIKGNASRPIDMERAVTLAGEADVWLNPGDAGSKEELERTVPRLKGTRIFTHGRIYANTKRTTPSGGNDYFETGTVRPDLVLRDLQWIFSGSAPEDSLFFYRELK